MGVMHRDLKPQNLLIAKGHLKIADFGLSRSYDMPLQPRTKEVITLWYRAPELLLGSPLYSHASDMWSAGCVFAELINGAPFFPGSSELTELYLIFQILGTPTEITWPGVTSLKNWNVEFPQWKSGGLDSSLPWMASQGSFGEHGVDLIHQLFDYKPNNRISAARALSHGFFTMHHADNILAVL
ncbi:Cyclin-dependent kinase catalytic subunit [Podila epigama]|nr:Cyclin-dependent kinase catalytic subunit [Podila epigama]